MKTERFKPSRSVSNFSPAETVTVPASSTAVAEFRGYGGKEFGFNRLTIGSTDFDNITVKAVLNNEITLFDGVHLSVLRKMFLERSLLAPFIVQENNFLELTFTNHSASNVELNVQMHGYDYVALQEWRAFNARTGRKPVKPAFLFGADTVSASQSRKHIRITEKSTEVMFNRMFVGSSIEADTRVSMDVNNDTIKKEVFLSQINDEFEAMQSLIPYYLGKRTPFDLLVTNKNVSNAIRVSFIAEAYEVN